MENYITSTSSTSSFNLNSLQDAMDLMSGKKKDIVRFKIACAVCNKSVEEIIYKRDEDRQMHIFTVQCHGDRETTELPFSTDPHDLRNAVAFTNKKIGGSENANNKH